MHAWRKLIHWEKDVSACESQKNESSMEADGDQDRINIKWRKALQHEKQLEGWQNVDAAMKESLMAVCQRKIEVLEEKEQSLILAVQKMRRLEQTLQSLQDR